MKDGNYPMTYSKRLKERLDEDGELERYCPHCQEWWPATLEFYHARGKGRGLSSWCRACRLEDMKTRTYKKSSIITQKYYIANKQRILEIQREYRKRKYHSDFEYAEHQRKLNRKSHNRGVCEACGGNCYFNAQFCRNCYIKKILKTIHNPTFNNTIEHRREFFTGVFSSA